GYAVLLDAVKHNPEAAGILETLQAGFTKNTFSNARIQSTIIQHSAMVREMFRHFCSLNNPIHSAGADPDRSTQERSEFEQLLEREVPYHRDRRILSYFLRFNEFVENCNFFRTDKAALSFRLRSGFLSDSDYLEEPHGVFFVVGRQFIGFHVRFRDIARGGIRIVRSRTADAYARNIDTVFQENYNLAATQQRKNKDIPEGGAKGILLLNAEFATGELSAGNAFRAYVDSLLDLLPGTDNEGAINDTALPANAPAAASTTPTDEALFLGPDEGSAGLMDWAALHARRRGYPYWKSFTTGKPPSLGGLPHDRYGMTTRSVHAYVVGVLEKLGLKEEEITKIQTGGPDGDLGSNEILISKDTTLAVVDGSGVAYDPHGLNRNELRRLALARQSVDQFSRELLSPEGFFVGVADRDLHLPDGSSVTNGEVFRNRFHLSRYFNADVFVPCGGRPGAITVANWKNLLDEAGTPRVKVIVEGANLFITQEARLRLEAAGVLVFKDASTNKGGVTSSSFEVYAGLALSDEQWSTEMCFEHEESELRRALVKEITDRIEHNARAEFELLWKEHERRNIPFTLLSDQISERINRIAAAVMRSPFLTNHKLRSQMITRYTPHVLLDAVGLEVLVERVPTAYLDAVTAASIAAEFVYQHGLDAYEVEFAEYLQQLQDE
ncbi:MAG: NAD-glutamate dehydrogenase, partial [Spirochaeta sp.]|nr:NAD-glutamate dehydrogenase [Spirochaeta sp.]